MLQIPDHWQRKRLKYLSNRSIRNGLGKAGEFADSEHPRYIRITDIAGPRRLRPDTFRSLPPEVAVGARVHKNDILISAVGATYGKSFYAEELTGEACFAGYLVRISPVPEVDPSFLAYWTESDDYWAQINANVIQTTIQNFSAAKVRNLSAPIPPRDTQKRIARFLKDASRRIDQCVSAKKKLIGLLEEYRLTLISNVVMGRIDIRTEKNHEKKGDLGSCHQIPRHWQRKRLKYLSSRSIRNGLGKAGKFANPEHPRYIRTTDIAGPRQLRPDTFRSLPPEMAREAQVYENDILISSAGSVGKSFYAKKLDGKACFAGYLVRISPVPEIDPSFIAYWTESDDYWAQINANVIQTTIQNFSATKVRNLSAPIPPLDTQRHIVRFLDDADWRISTRQKLLKREIALLREYQTRLISDVVTGKLDVREAADALPDIDSCTAEVTRTKVSEFVTKV